MGAMDEGCLAVEFAEGSKLDLVENGVNNDPVTYVIEDAVRVLLRGLGEDVNREGIRSTPRRVAKAFMEGTRGYSQEVDDIVQGAVFAEPGLTNGWVGQAGGDGGLVLVRDLDLYSYCESCLLPFRVKCHVGYIPSARRVVGLSKISRLADVFSKRLQEPSRLAGDICSALHSGINPAGVAVALHCSHLHFPPSGPGLVQSMVSSGSGVFQNSSGGAWVDFLGLLKLKGVGNIDCEFQKPWCPLEKTTAGRPSSAAELEMVSAVTEILRLLGEDPSGRRELSGTASCFVGWLLRSGNHGAVATAETVPGEEKGEMDYTEAMSMPFWSPCEHHLLPFHGLVHVGYVGGGVERRRLESIVRWHSGRLQVQERLTRQIAEGVAAACRGGDVMVVVEAEHMCMSSRGVEEFGSSTATVAVLGRFSDDPEARAAFFQRVPCRA